MKRLSWIDIARAIAMIYVVIGHALQDGDVQSYIYSFHVALFFFISGMIDKCYQESFSNFIKKKFKQLIIPYLVFGIICILIYALLGRYAGDALGKEGLSFDIGKNLLGLLYGNSKSGYMKYNLPLWFLPCLFSTNILYYFARKLCKTNNGNIFIALICIFLGYLNNYIFHIKLLPFALETAVTMLVFHALGNWFYNQGYDKLLKPWCILFIALGAIIGVANGRIHYSADEYNNILLFYSGSIFSIMGYLALAKTIDHNTVLEYIGKSTMAILVMHKLPILFFQTVVGLTAKHLANNSLFVAVMVSVISIISCLIAQVIIMKIMPWALGRNENGNNRTVTTNI